MDTKDSAKTTAPSAAPAKPAPKPKPAGDPDPEQPVPSVPLSGLEDDSPESLRAAFSGLFVGTPGGKVKEMETGQGLADDDREVKRADVSSVQRPPEGAPSADEHPATSSPTDTILPATHPAKSPPTPTPPVAAGTGFTGMPYPTHGVEQIATEPPMAPSVSEPLAHPTLIFTSRPPVLNLVPIIGPLLV